MTAIEVPTPFKVGKVRAPVVTKGKSGGVLGLNAGVLSVGVQVIAPAEGETNLHSHTGVDSAWFVLDGEAEFWGTDDDVLIGRLGKNEGISIPAGTPYWFKCSSPSQLVILHITARTPAAPPAGQTSRVNHRPTSWYGEEGHAELLAGVSWEGGGMFDPEELRRERANRGAE